MENSDEVRFQHYFISLVEQVAKPLFVDSCEEARSYGLDCNVDLDLDEDGHPRLRLEVGEPGGEKSHYSLLAIPGERVIHRQYLAGPRNGTACRPSWRRSTRWCWTASWRYSSAAPSTFAWRAPNAVTRPASGKALHSFQISRAYSLIVRSALNQPIRATLSNAERHQRSGSRQTSSTRHCACQ